MKSYEEKVTDKDDNQICHKPLADYEEVEIKLRTCKLLGIYDLSIYEGRKF